MEDQLTPRLVEVVEDVHEEAADEEGKVTREGTEQKQAEAEESARPVWKAAACGGGFTVAITDDGRVYSWGMWARGRLGECLRTLRLPLVLKTQ
jgi:hypothetical protein